MADKAAQLDAINKAIASGLTEFTFDGQTSKYRSLSEMRDIRDELRRELGQVTSTRTSRARTFSSFDKGY